ncbi:MAG: FAD-binding oxidoreductase [Gemmatimonadota bacterium]
MTPERDLKLIQEYEPADLVISVGSAVTLLDINAATTPHKQFMALDPAVPAHTTIGSIVATGVAGPLRYAHGTPRDQVLGLEVVTADGHMLEFGGKVVKNVAGYDLVRLLVGSRGTLGFITRVSIRLKPLPAVDRTIALAVPSFDEAATTVAEVLSARLDPVALEIVSWPSWTVLIRFHGNEEAVADGIRHVGADGMQLHNGNDVWNALAETEARAPVNIRLANLPSLLRETAAHAIRLSERAGLERPRFAIHAGNGIVRMLADGAGANTANVLVAERALIMETGGTLRVERLPGAQVADAIDAATLTLMRRIKHAFDPAGILG